MSTETQATSSGISFGGLLCVLFIGLKLTGYITWTWWWVLSPLWIPFVIFVGVMALILLGLGVAAMMKAIVG